MSYAHVEHDRSLRLTFQFDGPNIELLGITESRARPMPAEPVSELEPTEFWYELRDDDDDSTLYQRPVRNPLMAGVEYVTGDSERPLTRELPEGHRGRFQLTVPAVDGTSVVLFGVVPGREQDRPKQLGNFKIRQPEPVFAS